MKISGKIVDAENIPLGCANIMLVNGDKANRIGTFTDNDGNYTLENDLINEDSEIEISFDNFIPKKLKPSDLQETTITLQDAELETPKLEKGFRLKKETVSIDVKDKKIEKVKVKSNFKNHLESHGEKYSLILLVAGIAVIVKSLKK